MTHRTTPYAVLACACLALAACGSTGTDSSPTTLSASPAASAVSASAGSTTSPGTTSASGLSVRDAWVKAAPTLDGMAMTGAFGTVTNTTSQDITIVSATQDASAKTELHETAMVDGTKVMREVRGGFTIKAGQSLELRPGGNHLMLMGMTRPLPVGSEVTFTVTTSTGGRLTWAAPAKQFTAPQENYVPGDGASTSAGPTVGHGTTSTR